MNDIEDKRRLFFGFEVHAPWPKTLPGVETLKAKHRHLTLAFLGDTSYNKLRNLIPKLPKPHFRSGAIGISDSYLSLPKRHPNIVTWHVEPFGEDLVEVYQKELVEFLEKEGYALNQRKFLKHVTLGKSICKKKEWQKNFRPLPLYFHNLHLYESFGGLQYEPIWSHDLLPPFEKVGTQKDFILRVYGSCLKQLFHNTQIALAFSYPKLLPFLDPRFEGNSIEEVISQLNTIVHRASREGVIFPLTLKCSKNIGSVEGALTWEISVIADL